MQTRGYQLVEEDVSEAVLEVTLGLLKADPAATLAFLGQLLGDDVVAALPSAAVLRSSLTSLDELIRQRSDVKM